MTEEKHQMVKAVADSLLLMSAGLSALAGIPPDVFNEKELGELNEALRSIEVGREQLLGLVSRLESFDDEMKAQLLRQLESSVPGAGSSPQTQEGGSSCAAFFPGVHFPQRDEGPTAS